MNTTTKVFLFLLGGLILLSACDTLHQPRSTSVAAVSPTIRVTIQASPAPTPTLSLVAESAEEFLVLNTIPKIASSETFYVASSVVKNKEYLNEGPSIRTNDIRRCWLYTNKTLSDCSPKILLQPEFKDIERVFFAVGSFDEDRILFIVDDYPFLIPQTVIEAEGIGEDIKGYRALLVKEDGRWNEKSLVRIRIWPVP
jgi:hypothetical protein